MTETVGTTVIENMIGRLILALGGLAALWAFVAVIRALIVIYGASA